MVDYSENTYKINVTLTEAEYMALTQAAYEYQTMEKEFWENGLTSNEYKAITGAINKIDIFAPEYRKAV